MPIDAISNTNSFPLAGKTALVTGGSRGIGKAIVRKLASLGAAVAFCGKDETRLREAAQELAPAAPNLFAQRADVTREEDVRSLVNAVEIRLGPIAILINNAGIGSGGFGPIHEKSLPEWERVIDTNLKSVFLVSRAVIPGMIERRAGDIINIGSLAGKSSFAGGALYCASKWGLRGLSACMAEDLRVSGIRVSLVSPGSVYTDFEGRGPKDPSKVLTADDVAHVVGMVLTQGPQSFLSELDLRPLARP